MAMVRGGAWRLALVLSLGAPCRPARAQLAAPVEPAIAPPPKYRVVLSARGLVGSVFEDNERRLGGGAGLLVGIPVFEERWELEASGAFIKPEELPPLGVFEVVTKRMFEPAGPIVPHVVLGPALSLDLRGAVLVKGGLVLGAGLAWFVRRGFGVAADVAYRFLAGAGGIEHVLSLSAGPVVRL
jgi:hypothetical protein